MRQKKQTLKELNDKIAVFLETPEELEAELLNAEELDSLIMEKVCVTDNLIELAKRNLSQHVLSQSPENISIPSSSLQKGQSTIHFIYVANGTRKSTIQSFWDSFRCSVHDNSLISDVQKFNYLRAELRDGAERVIAGLPLTSANYTRVSSY